MTPYLLLIAARSRQPLAPAVATLFVLLGVFAYRPNDVGSTWGLTGLLAMALACWATAAVPRGEPDEQADVATVALGGTGRPAAPAGGARGCGRRRSHGAVHRLPVVLDVFDRPVRAGDVASAVVVHGTVSPGLLIASSASVLLAAALLGAAARWDRRRAV